MYKVILLHHGDLDGAGCRICFELAHDHLKNGEEYATFNCDNPFVDSTINQLLNEGNIAPDQTMIYFGDICASHSMLLKLAGLGYHCMIIDHHPTNMHALEVYPESIIKPENDVGVKQSGTNLMYQYFYSLNPTDPRTKWFINHGNHKLLSQLVENIRLYDTYEFKQHNDVKPKCLNTLFFMLGMDRFCNRYITRIKDDNSSLVLIDDNDMDFVSAKMDVEQRAIDNFTENDVYPVNIRGYNVALVLHTKGAGISELAYQFLTKHPEYDIMIGLSMVGDGKFEIRCVKDGIDTGVEIAKPIGGGGHPAASGAPFTREDKLRLVDFLVDILDPQQNNDENYDNGLITDDYF